MRVPTEHRLPLYAVAAAALPACAAEDPEPTPMGEGEAEAEAEAEAESEGEAEAEAESESECDFPGGGDDPACQAMASDYAPGADDTWPPCLADGGEYRAIGDSPSTIARVEAFERIADLLFSGGAPSSEDFIEARLIYLEEQGLESRLARREDEHYQVAPAAW